MTLWVSRFGIATRAEFEEQDGIPLYVPNTWSFWWLGPIVIVDTHQWRRLLRLDR